MNSLSCTRARWVKIESSKVGWVIIADRVEMECLPWKRKSWRWSRGVGGCRWLWPGESVAGTCASSWQWSGGEGWVRFVYWQESNKTTELVNLVRPWAPNNPPHCKHKNLFVKELEQKIPGKSTLLNSFQEFWPLHYFWAKVAAASNSNFEAILKMFAAGTLWIETLNYKGLLGHK